MDQTAAKKKLQELVKRDDLGNRVCVDCGSPNPQWASLSFAVFMCLQCAGMHRGFGVHITFVRSLSMDTWQDDQLRRMQLGGNGPFREFMRGYRPVEQGGYSESQSIHDTYHCWAATQYRQKLDYELMDKEWSPSPPPEPASPALRKSRRAASSSPAPTPPVLDQKQANEIYFSSLGQANANRPDHLPPSQGGRYQGFGSTPPQNTPSTTVQDNPMAALSKGWSFLSSAVIGASKVVNENVIQPGMEKVSDPELQRNVKGYLEGAKKGAVSVGSSANAWGKTQFGVDVAGSVGEVVGKLGGGPAREGYGAVPTGWEGEGRGLYAEADDEAPAPPPKKPGDGWDDDWKEF
ncbi:ArfGap-domain-containing protein [Guyanagaster necrorhizus]|uniref:ArfGap-domain-containing protein n=1 Tax=Guyanagaster necrorhizus TaxID=856835 RepID=A0A9P7VV31_9AGAR|nr:ArfGap-domain-containing protein [Guyanagaster necrorhizus MCA 3950]KAG7447474.1 ArfGap-domain-containing protein [Guyanagaster necrorhizus MCA 3950]